MNSKDICKWYDMCPLKRFYERKALDKQWIENYCWSGYSNCVRYKMEETVFIIPTICCLMARSEFFSEFNLKPVA